MTRLREMPRALEPDKHAAGHLGDGDGALARLAPVQLAVDDEHWAANTAAQRASLLVREDKRLGASVQAPLGPASSVPSGSREG
jgi:hypothetical protein